MGLSDVLTRLTPRRAAQAGSDSGAADGTAYGADAFDDLASTASVSPALSRSQLSNGSMMSMATARPASILREGALPRAQSAPALYPAVRFVEAAGVPARRGRSRLPPNSDLLRVHDQLRALPTFAALTDPVMDKDVFWTFRDAPQFDVALKAGSNGTVEVHVPHRTQAPLASGECRALIKATLNAYVLAEPGSEGTDREGPGMDRPGMDRSGSNKPHQHSSPAPASPRSAAQPDLATRLAASPADAENIRRAHQQHAAIRNRLARFTREQEVDLLRGKILTEAADARIIKPRHAQQSWTDTVARQRTLKHRIAEWQSRDPCFQPVLE